MQILGKLRCGKKKQGSDVHYLDNTSTYNEYIKCKQKEQIIDVDKITYYLDKEI